MSTTTKASKKFGYHGTGKPMWGMAWVTFAKTCDWCETTRTASLKRAALLCTNPKRVRVGGCSCNWHDCPYIQEGAR